MTVFRPQRKSRTTSGSFYFRFQAGGQTYEQGGYPTKSKAATAEWKKRGEVGARGPQHEPPTGAGPAARLADYASTWLEQLGEQVARGDLAPRTLRSYRELYDGHILPALGRRPLLILTRPVLMAFLDGKRAALSKNTVRLLRSALSALLTDALEAGDLTAHPLAQGGRRRRGQAASETERQAKIRPMTREQRDLFLRVGRTTSGTPSDTDRDRDATSRGASTPRTTPWGGLPANSPHNGRRSTIGGSHTTSGVPPSSRCDRSTPYPLLFELLAKTGLRPGEAFALTVGDVDLDRGVLHITKAWDGQSIRDTKTHQRRVVDLTAGLVERLRDHVRRPQDVVGPGLVKSGPTPGVGTAVSGTSGSKSRRCTADGSTLLFLSASGQPLKHKTVVSQYRRDLARAKLPVFRLYDLRHTYASLRIAEGAPITYVAQQLGHLSPAMTLKHYARWVPTEDRQWVEDDGAAARKVARIRK